MSFSLAPRNAQDVEDFPLYPDTTAFMMQHGLPTMAPEANTTFSFSDYAGTHPTSTTFALDTVFADTPNFALASPEIHSAASNYSTASGPSAASSAMGSPPHFTGQAPAVPEWSPMNLVVNPGAFHIDNYGHQGNEYAFRPGMTELAALDTSFAKSSFVDPLSLHPGYAFQADAMAHVTDSATFPPHLYSTSPAISPVSSLSPHPQLDNHSPFLDASFTNYPYPANMQRRSSVAISHHSYNSQDGSFSSEEARDKGRCTYPECGKFFKDLKAHMLTHQTERPEKCPISTCEYHVKGFARKYDKNRHTLTHYKGTMVCGFCPGSGSAAEKSFNRADVFKRHLTSVHAVEQSPPNCRKKSHTASGGSQATAPGPGITGKCSTCSATFSNAQDFYEHLDDCVLRIVQQEEPSEAINVARLAEVEQDSLVQETLMNNYLPTTSTNDALPEDAEEDDEDVDTDDALALAGKTKTARSGRNPINGVQKSRGMTHSKGGVTLNTKGRKKRKDYPASWGCQPSQMKMKKRVLTVFDGPRRLWKDDMMLDMDYEVRMKLADDNTYITDLDVQSLRRADAFLGATDAEKGPWIADDLTGFDLEELIKMEGDF